MPQAAIEVGSKLHIITRRRFENDVRRHFAGEVRAISDDLQEIQGYAFVFEPKTNEYVKRPELRTRIFSVAQEGYIVTKLPAEIDIGSLHYRLLDKRLVVTNGDKFVLEFNEFGGVR